MYSTTSCNLNLGALEQQSTHNLANRISHVGSSQDGDWPLLPSAVPVERDGHSTDPSTNQSSDRGTKDLVNGCSQCANLDPFGTIDTVDVEKRVGGEEGDVETAVNGVGLVGGERGTEEDEDDGDEGSSESDGEDERENSRLYRELVRSQEVLGLDKGSTYDQLGTEASVSLVVLSDLALLLSTLRQLGLVATGDTDAEV